HQPLSRELDQLTSHLQQATFQLGFARLPRDAAELVENRFRRLGAVSGQEYDVFNRQELTIIACIVDLNAVVWRTRRLNGLQTDKSADAVIGVDDDITCRKC